MNPTNRNMINQTTRLIIYHQREQILDDVHQLVLDIDHWNRIHSDEEPIVLSLDFTGDVAAARTHQMQIEKLNS